VDLDQHGSLVRHRVTPVVRDVEVGSADCGDEQDVLNVYTPTQPFTSLPIVVPAPTRGKNATTAEGAMPYRSGKVTRRCGRHSGRARGPRIRPLRRNVTHGPYVGA
jgi:hypothetical protein